MAGLDVLFAMVDKQSLKAGQTVCHHLDTLSRGHKNTDQMVTGQIGCGR